MITNEIRQEKVKSLSEPLFELYTSVEITLLIKQCLTKYQITNNDAFIDTLGDTVIGLLPRNALEKNLVVEVGLTADTARLILLDLKVFLDKVPNENPGLPVANLESRERLELHPDGEKRPPISVREVEATPAHPEETPKEMTAEDVVAKLKENEAKPLTREELMKALAGKRTMAGDIEAVRKMREDDTKDA